MCPPNMSYERIWQCNEAYQHDSEDVVRRIRRDEPIDSALAGSLPGCLFCCRRRAL